MSDSFATPWTIAHQASLSTEFSRREYWIAISFSRASSQPRDRTRVSCIGRRILYHWTTRQVLLSWCMNADEKCCLSLTEELELLAVGREAGTFSELLWLNDENSIFSFWNGQRLSGDQTTKRPGMWRYSLSNIFPSVVTRLSSSLHFHAVKTGQQLKYGQACGVLCVTDRFLPWSLILRLFWGSI